MRRAARTDATQALIVRALRDHGAHVTSLAAVGGGVPDLLVSYAGRWFVMEVKRPAGPRGGRSADGQRLRESQEAFVQAARAPVSVVRSGVEAIDALRVC